jgi:hypothetical protein
VGVTVVSGAGVSLSVGQVWELVIAVTDPGVTPTVAVTGPAGGDPDEVVVEPYGWIGYVAAYVPVVAGLHVALISAGALGAVAAAANVIAIADATTRPDRTALDNYLGEHSATDGELDDALAAETQAQWDTCRVPAAYPYSLRQALLRRCARNLALRGLPLAVLRGDGESGDTVLPGSDPEVRRLEKPWRKLKVG